MTAGDLIAVFKSVLKQQLNARNLRGYGIVGVCARRYHSVIWAHEAVFTFGLNAGQLGQFYRI